MNCKRKGKVIIRSEFIGKRINLLLIFHAMCHFIHYLLPIIYLYIYITQDQLTA